MKKTMESEEGKRESENGVRRKGTVASGGTITASLCCAGSLVLPDHLQFGPVDGRYSHPLLKREVRCIAARTASRFLLLIVLELGKSAARISALLSWVIQDP